MTNKKAGIAGRYKTLGLSNYGDERILAEIDSLIHRHEKKQPYSRNTLWRIKEIVDQYLEVSDVEQSKPEESED